MARGKSRPGFWTQISDGMALSQLWAQLRRDSTLSYQLYAAEAAAQRAAQQPQGRRRRHLWQDFVWAIVMKLTPVRRVLLFLAIVLLVLGEVYTVLGVLVLLGLLALEVADRVGMKRDLEIAREIQMWLLPKQPPAAAGADLAFTNLPANTVSGDYYDAFLRTPDRLLLVVADVAGKGLPAAMLMATLQASLRTLAAQSLSLDALVEALNQYASRASLGGTRFTTAFIAELDVLDGRMRFCNAGHNPPLLRRASDGSLTRLEEGGVPLGILPDANYACGEARLTAGDTVVFYSDGLTESFDPQQQEYGEERLTAALQRALALRPEGDAAWLLQSVVGDCERFREGVRQQDDLTCMVLRFQRQAQRSPTV